MKKLAAIILAIAILSSITGVASALVKDGVDYPNQAYVTYSVEYKPEQAAELLAEINAFRKSDAWYYESDGSVAYAGILDDLIVDDSLTQAAMYRAAQQAILCSHTQPSGAQACIGVHDDVLMENLAYGAETSNQAFNGLAEEKQSFKGQGHRRSMLSNATHVGVGCVSVNGITYWAIEYAFEEPTQEANTIMTEDTVTTLVNTKVIGTKNLELKVSSTSVSCKVGKSVSLPAVYELIGYGSVLIDPIQSVPSDVKWTVNDPTVATLNGNSITGVKEGKTSATASVLGQSINVSIIVDKATCAHRNTSERVTQEATCAAGGQKEVYCADCGTVVGTCAIPKKSHTIAERVVQEATFDSEGLKDTYCTVCGMAFGEQTVIPRKTCTHGATAERITREATCTAEGSKEKFCTDCGAVVEIIAIPKQEHTTAERVVKEATLTAEGTKETYCAVCGTVISTAGIPRKTCDHGNTAERVTKEATCTADGSKEKYCKDCSAVIETIVIPKKGHITAERVTKEATVTAEGTKETYCTVCGDVTNTTSVPKKTCTHSHTAERVTKEATCTADGSKGKYCKDCGAIVETIVIPKKGHTTAERITKEATVTVEGTKETYCTVCDTVISSTSIPKKTCDHSNTTETVTLEPKCWREGAKEIHCTDCGAYIRTETIPKTDHTWSSTWRWVADDTGDKGFPCTEFDQCHFILWKFAKDCE